MQTPEKALSWSVYGRFLATRIYVLEVNTYMCTGNKLKRHLLSCLLDVLVVLLAICLVLAFDVVPLLLLLLHRLVGLVVRRPPREQKIPGSNPACAGNFSGSSHTSDLKIGTPVATLPGALRYRVSAGTGRPGVSILWVR